MKKNAYADVTAGQGMGIDALFADAGNQYSLIYLDQIEVAAQIRETFEDEENTLAELASSIKARGLLQPILLRPSGTGYTLVAGERRYRACRLAGLEQIPAYIREMTDEEAEDAQLAENIHRKNLTQIEEAKKIQRDLDRLGSIEAVLEKHQKSRSWLSKILSLLHLPEQTKRLVTENVSADLEIINTVKTIEKADPKAAKELVDDLKDTRGKDNARDKVQVVKETVKPSIKKKKAEGKAFANETENDPPARTDETIIFAPAKKSKGNAPDSPVSQTHGGLQTATTAENSEYPTGMVAFSSPLDTLRHAYTRIYEYSADTQTVQSAMAKGDKEGAEAWLREFFDAGMQTNDAGRAVIQGLRDGRFATEGENAFALIAFLHGANNEAQFNFLDILGGVRQ